MLQDIRKNVQGTAAKIVVGLIVISFSIFGIESILLGGGGNSIAEVNGEEISPQELQQSIDTQKRRLIAMMGENYDPALLDDERLAGQALEALVSRKLLTQSARDLNLAVSEVQIGSLVGSMEQFQVDGEFSPDVYKSVLSSAGYTPSYFKQILRDDMLVNQLRSGLAGSDFATPAELALGARIISEQRDVRFLTIPQEKFVSQEPVSDVQVEAYYSDHKADFRTLESVDIDYIELSMQEFFQPVDERALMEAFEIARESYEFQTRNRVSHILFEDGGDVATAERVARAQERLENGIAFAEVAREFSDDIGSAGKGGDLGYSTGSAFPGEMESVIAQLEPGKISAPLETDAGTHLILVTERSEGEEPSLEEMRPQLEESLQAEQARVELLLAVESLKDLAFNAEDLDAPAAELDLSVKREDGITRSHSEGVMASPSLLEAAFSDDVLNSGHNSEVIELANDRFVVLRVRAHKLPEAKPLELVREQIVAALIEDKARAALTVEAQRALAELRSGVSVEDLANSQGYEWRVELGVSRSNNTVPSDVLRRTFELPAPTDGSASTDYLLTQAGDAVVIKLVNVSAGDYASLAEQEQLQLQQQVSSEFGSLVNTEFDRGLRDNAEITTVL